MAADLALAVACLRQVEGGEALHEQLAEHHALADPRREAKADALGEEGEQRLDLPHVARLEMGEAVTQHHPVDRRLAGDDALVALLPHQLAVHAWRLPPPAPPLELRPHLPCAGPERQ